MSNTNFDDAQINTINKMKKQGKISDEQYDELIEFDKQRKNGMLTKNDFLCLMGLYKDYGNNNDYLLIQHYRFNGIVINEIKFTEIKEIFQRKINGLIIDESDKPVENFLITDEMMLYKMVLSGQIDFYEFKTIKNIFFKYKIGTNKERSKEIQLLSEFMILRRDKIINNDDFNEIVNFIKMRSMGFVFFEELNTIKKLYQTENKRRTYQKNKNQDDQIPKYDMARIFKLKFQEQISTETYIKMKTLLIGHRARYKLETETESVKKDLDTLLFLLENG